VITLLGKIEANVASATEQTLLRILTPLLKLYTAKQAIAVTTEAIESLGGTGYMEVRNLTSTTATHIHIHITSCN